MGYILKRYCVGLLFAVAVIMLFSGCAAIQNAEKEIVADESFARVLPPDVEEKFPKLTNLPALYITLDNMPFSSVGKDEYVFARYTLVYDGWDGRYDEALTIKGRGNYSWSFPQKPYTLKLEKKKSMLGMDSAKKWVLLTTYSDKTLLRNYLTLKLAADVSMDYQPDCEFVDVFLNGEYNGCYLLTESIQIRENRLDIDIETEGLFEIEAAYRHGDHSECSIVPSGLHIMYKKPDGEDLPPETRAENLQKFRSFFTELDISLDNGYEEYSQYIDVDSFVDWYIINEFVKNFDSGFTSSCYCYIKDGKLHMGPVWDYDTCYGNQQVETCIDPEGYHVNTSPWYQKLTEDEDFSWLIRCRWKELRDNRVIDDFLVRLLDTAEYLAEAEKKDHERWPHALTSRDLRGSKSRYTFEDEVDYLIDWIMARIAWLDGEWYAAN